MAGFETTASTTRSGTTIEHVVFDTDIGAQAGGYLFGRSPDRTQPLAIALHDERGDQATLLPDLEILAARGFVCLSLDSPACRQAAAERDHLAAFNAQFAAGLAALKIFGGEAQSHSRIGLLGRGIGAEAAVSLAAYTREPQVVVAMNPLPNRGDFIANSPHVLAAGIRQFRNTTTADEQAAGLRSHALVTKLAAAPGTHFVVQLCRDDDRVSDADHANLAQHIPRTVRVDYFNTTTDLRSNHARRARAQVVRG